MKRFAPCFSLMLAGSIPIHGAPLAAADIVVDGSKAHQTIEGSGTCLIAWQESFRKLYRTEAFQRLYTEGVGCSMLRVNLWGPVASKPVQDWKQIRWQVFDMTADGGRAQIFIDFAQGLLKIDPNMKVIGTVWSPPAWMKVNNSIVLLNPTASDQAVNLVFRNLPDFDSLKVYRTSASEGLKPLGAPKSSGGRARIVLPAQSMATVSALERPSASAERQGGDDG